MHILVSTTTASDLSETTEKLIRALALVDYSVVSEGS